MASTMTTAATMLATARHSAGLTQRALAARVGRPQARVSDVESGHRDTTVGHLEQLLAATGQRLIAVPTTATTAADTAVEVRRWLAIGDTDRALRVVVQLADDLVNAPIPVLPCLVVQPAPPIGDRRWDALIAAVVDYRCTGRVAVPPWVREETRRLSEPWALSAYSNTAATPAAIRRHGIILDAEDLVSV